MGDDSWDMKKIKLTKRYPLSRPKDVTDAYMRGYEHGRKSIESLECENAKLRLHLKETGRVLLAYAHDLDEISNMVDESTILTTPFVELYLKGIGVDLGE